MIDILRSEMVMIDKVQMKVAGFSAAGMNSDEFARTVVNLGNDLFTIRHSYQKYAFLKLRTRRQNRILAEMKLYHNRTTNSVTLFMDVTINPTRILRHKSFNFLTLESLDDNDNFLPQDLYTTHDRAILAAETRSLLHNTLEDLLGSIVEIMKQSSTSNNLSFTEPSISITHLELYWDMFIEDAILFTEKNRKLFQSMFKNNEAKPYTVLLPRDKITRNSYGLAAFPLKNERIMIYPKFVDSLRVETLLNSRRIRELVGTSVIGSNTIVTLDHIIDCWYQRSITNILKFFEQSQSALAGQSDKGQILYNLSRACKNHPQFIKLISLLATTGRVIANNSSKYLLAKLLNQGLVTRIDKGVYQVPQDIKNLLQSYIDFISDNKLNSRKENSYDSKANKR